MRQVLLVFIGGGLGSVGRYLVSRRLSGFVASVFPYPTFLVNVTGCFLIGFLLFITPRMGSGSNNWRYFLVTGICGGYTTFSTFSFENVELITDRHSVTMLLYSTGSLIAGFLATYIGILLARNI